MGNVEVGMRNILMMEIVFSSGKPKTGRSSMPEGLLFKFDGGERLLNSEGI